MKSTRNYYPQCKQRTTGSNPQHDGLQSKEIVQQQGKLTITTDLRNDSQKISYNHGKTAHMGVLSFLVPSRDVHSLFWVQ